MPPATTNPSPPPAQQISPSAFGVANLEVTSVSRPSGLGRYGALVHLRVQHDHRLAFLVVKEGALLSGADYASGRSNVVAIMLDNSGP